MELVLVLVLVLQLYVVLVGKKVRGCGLLGLGAALRAGSGEVEETHLVFGPDVQIWINDRYWVFVIAV